MLRHRLHLWNENDHWDAEIKQAFREKLAKYNKNLWYVREGKEQSACLFFHLALCPLGKREQWPQFWKSAAPRPTPAISLLSVSLKYTGGGFKMNTMFLEVIVGLELLTLFCSMGTRLWLIRTLVESLLILCILSLRYSPYLKNGTLYFTNRFKIVLSEEDGLSHSSLHFLDLAIPKDQEDACSFLFFTDNKIPIEESWTEFISCFCLNGKWGGGTYPLLYNKTFIPGK